MSNTSDAQPALTDWFKSQITTLYTASSTSTESDEFKTSFESAFADDAQVVANLETIKLDAFQQELLGRASAAQRVDMEWNDMIEVPPKQDSGGSGEFGIVAGMFTVTRSLKFRIRAGPMQNKTKVVFTAKVTAGDKPKISQLNLVHVDQAVPIQLAPVPQQ